MWGLLTSIPSLLTGIFTTVSTVSTNLANEKIAFMNATTDRERAEIGERISALQQTRAVLVAESARSKLPTYMQVFGALGPFMYVFTYFAWDKVMGKFAGCVGHTAPDQVGSLFWVEVNCKLFETDPLDANAVYIMLMVFGFFFAHTAVGMWKQGT